jgi:hypothetical protein
MLVYLNETTRLVSNKEEPPRGADWIGYSIPLAQVAMGF